MEVNFDKIAKRFAKREGYNGADHLGQWEGFEVFCATSNEPVFIGLPPYILVSEDSARWPTASEQETLFELF